MNKCFFFGSLLLCGLPLGAIARQSILTGTWTLTNKQYLQGPIYENGVPKLLTINGATNKTTLALTTTIGEKDTVELETFERALHDTQVLITTSGRQKKIKLSKPTQQNLWIRQVNLSARDNVNQLAILIVDSLLVSEDSNHLTLIRRYDGEDALGGNQDYAMLATYKKITAEQLAQETATGKGVVWVSGLTWPQLLEKALKGKKYLFVDCYATWCGPCKTMDREVFPLNRVGSAMNNQFLAVKVQMDTGKNDPVSIQLTYPIARQLEQQYKVEALPCYLFFDGTGQLLHKEVGAFKTEEFVKILQNAAMPDSQLYNRYRQAMAGNLLPSDLLILAEQIINPQYGEWDMAKTLVRTYINRQFYVLNDQALLTKDNLEFILKYWSVVESKDRIFKLFHRDPNRINQILGKKSKDEFAQQMLEDIIRREELTIPIRQADSIKTTPNWEALQETITRKYGSTYAVRPILNAKVGWYQKHQQWELYCNNLYQQVEMNINLGADYWDYFNSMAWELFLYSTKKEQLEGALRWTQRSIDLQNTQNIEHAPLLGTCSTYGNLLYKLDRKREAIAWYKEMVVDRAPVGARLWSNTLNRMMQNQPTWKDREKWTNNPLH